MAAFTISLPGRATQNRMFEGNIHKQFESAPARRGDLRSLRWTDLVARLSETRTQRGDCGKSAGGGFAGFAKSRREDCEEGKRSFNPHAVEGGEGRVVRVVDGTQGQQARGDREGR